jgi:hypothetical protein
MDSAEVAEEEEEQTAWYTPGLYRRIGRRRRREERPKRLTIRGRLSARGLHWNTELVVGVFVAVLVASLVAVSVVRVNAGRTFDFRSAGGTSAGAGAAGTTGGGGSGDGGLVTPFPTPTAPCIAGPIPGSPLRPCTW